MAFAKIIDGSPVELPYGQDVETGEAVTSYASISLWSDQDRAACGISTIVEPVVPDGQRIASAELQVIDGAVVRVAEFEAAPVVRRLVAKSLITKRLHEAGKLAAAVAVLNDPVNLYANERWRTPDWPNVYADDDELVAVLTAIGADVETITAP